MVAHLSWHHICMAPDCSMQNQMKTFPCSAVVTRESLSPSDLTAVPSSSNQGNGRPVAAGLLSGSRTPPQLSLLEAPTRFLGQQPKAASEGQMQRLGARHGPPTTRCLHRELCLAKPLPVLPILSWKDPQSHRAERHSPLPPHLTPALGPSLLFRRELSFCEGHGAPD